MAVKKKARKATAPETVEEVEATEEADLEVTENEDEALELDEEEAPALKAKKKAAPKAAPIEYGSAWLAEHVNEQAGTSYDAYSLRILLRKLTKEGVLEREEGNGRARYQFTGAKDPQVKAIVKAVKEGAADKAKQERLDELKAKRAEKKTTTKKATKSKKAKAEVEPEVEDEDDLEVDEI